MAIITILPLPSPHSNASFSLLNRRFSSPFLSPAVNLRRITPLPCGFRVAAVPDAGAAVLHDAGAAVAVMTGAYALVATFDTLTQRNIIQQVNTECVLQSLL